MAAAAAASSVVEEFAHFVDKAMQMYNEGCEKIDVIHHLLTGLGPCIFMEPNRKEPNIYFMHVVQSATMLMNIADDTHFTSQLLCEKDVKPHLKTGAPKKPSRKWSSLKKTVPVVPMLKFQVYAVTFAASTAATLLSTTTDIAAPIISAIQLAITEWNFTQVTTLPQQKGWLLVPTDQVGGIVSSAASALCVLSVLYKERHIKRSKNINEKIYNEIVQTMDIPLVVFDLRDQVATSTIDPLEMTCTFVNAAFRELIANVKLDTSPHDQQYADQKHHMFSEFLAHPPIYRCLTAVMNKNKLGDPPNRATALYTSTSGSIKYRDASITISLEYGDDVIPKRHYEFHIYRVNGSRVGIVIKDISEKIQHLELIEQASRAKTDFLANVNHELRTPLNSIDGNLQLLMRTSPLTDRQLDLIHRMRLSGTALMSLLQEVLDYAKLEQHKMVLNIETFSLRHCLQSSIDVMSSLATTRQVVLAYNINVNVPTLVLGDSFRLQQVLVNLLSNAINFTTKGFVTVNVTLQSTTTTTTTTATAADRGGVENGLYAILFSVVDTGSGVDEKAQQYLFDAWKQGDPRRARATRGTGLGLAICKELVGLMDGTIWLEQTSSTGSTFCFTVQVKSDDHINASIAETEMRLLKGKQILILHTDDAIKKEMVKLLLSWGARPTCCTSYDEVINYLTAGYDFHVVLLDLQKACEPNSDIVTLASWITLHQPHLPLVGLTKVREPYNVACADLFRTVLWNPNESLFHVLVNILGQHSGDQHKAAAKKASVPSISKRRVMPKNADMPILIAEDVAENQLVLSDMLNSLGYTNVTVAANGNEMLDHLASSTYALVLVDLLMPEKDGIDAVREYRERHNKQLGTKPYIIAVTATNLITNDPKSYTAVGMDAFLQKPIKMNDLQTLLELV